VCAVRQAALAPGTVEVNATVIRVKGAGLMIQNRPKTAAGWRVLRLPPNLESMLDRRAAVPARASGPHGVVFASPRGRLRDPSNTSGDLRDALDALGFDWVTSHTFRKTVATRLDESGFTAREIADILGHEKPSMTQDVYMGRGVVSARMASVLDR
jgi:integrase